MTLRGWVFATCRLKSVNDADESWQSDDAGAEAEDQEHVLLDVHRQICASTDVLELAKQVYNYAEEHNVGFSHTSSTSVFDAPHLEVRVRLLNSPKCSNIVNPRSETTVLRRLYYFRGGILFSYAV